MAIESWQFVWYNLAVARRKDVCFKWSERTPAYEKGKLRAQDFSVDENRRWLALG